MDRNKSLSDRERQLLELAATGHTDTLIAQTLGISEATVATYWGRVRIKFGSLSRTELVANFIREQDESVIGELRRKNQHLVDQLEGSRSEPGVAQEAAYYRELILQAPDAVLIVLQDGMIETANEAACGLFGYDAGALDGAGIDTLIPDRYRLVHAAHREAFIEEGASRRMGEHLSTSGLHRLGREFPIDASLAPARTSQGLRIICVVRRA